MKLFVLFFLLAVTTNTQAQNSISKVLAITTSVNETNGTISLKWNKIPSATSYVISKKLRKDSAWKNIDTAIGNSDTTFTDLVTNKLIGYEYQIVTRGATPSASGCVYAAINLPANHYTGKLIVLIDSAYINYCSQEIKQYLIDIIKEGWSYNLKYISRTSSVINVKRIIKTMYEQDAANTKGVFILGHIAIPYSGEIYPDGHANHHGAWPTDGFYTDTSTTEWTDTLVNIATASRAENRNIPGDGKFDQWAINPTQVRLFVTRVDLYDMPAINTNDSLLIKNYLQKDHAYRSLQNKFRMRALVDDNFGYFSGEAFAQNGYRNGVNLLGKDSVMDGDYFTFMNSLDKSYLWSYGCGAGTYISAGGIGSTSNFQSSNVKSVFTMLFGSYFGDWDNSNNFLRAPLASNSSILTNCWAGRPNWFFHAMGLGECIGFSAYAQIKTPGIYFPSNYGSDFVHNELLGDPTLKMYMYDPPHNIVLTNTVPAIANVSWSPSNDAGVTGYYIYRTSSLSTPFILLNATPVITLSYLDNSASLGKNIYMIRAVKTQSTISSGTFSNLSAGVIDSITLQTTLPIQLLEFVLKNNGCNINLEWHVAQQQNVHHYEVLYSTDGIEYKSLGKVDATNASNYIIVHDQVCKIYPGKTIFYKLKTVDANGSYSFSNVLTAKIKGAQNISIFENPVNEYITINGLQKTGTIRIIDVNGKVLFQQNVNQESIKMNASFLPSGLYFLQYLNEGKTASLKFVKK